MTVTEMQTAMIGLTGQITTLIKNFESATGCIVHSVPVRPGDALGPVTAQIKVQVPPAA